MHLTGHPLLLAHAALFTIVLAICSLVVGLILSVAFAAGEMSRYRYLSWPITAFVTIIRGLPELLVVLFIYFGTPSLIHFFTGKYLSIHPFLSGVIALSLIFASYASQTWRGSLKAVSKGQRESAIALGISKKATFFSIILPQAIRHAVPGLNNQWLVLLKDTALVSLIGVTDLLQQAKLSAQDTHQSFTWYASAALIYLVITLISQRLIIVINKRYQLKENRSEMINKKKKNTVKAKV